MRNPFKVCSPRGLEFLLLGMLLSLRVTAEEPVAVIDREIALGWQANATTPAILTDDAAFVRRLYLDLIGRIPTLEERRTFLADERADRRTILVDQLLETEDHAVHFAEVLDAILIGRTDARQWKRRREVGWIEYLSAAIRKNRPWNQVAREILLARPESEEQRGATWYLYSRKDKAEEIAEAVSKDFFGVRIDCAQCHDHPLSDEIEQRHYWGLVAFFNRSKNVETPAGPRISESAVGGFSDFTSIYGDSAPNELAFLGERHVDEPRPSGDSKQEDSDELYLPNDGHDPKVPKFSRRRSFVDEVLKDHPLIGKAMVNRLWGWMMGRGLVHPVDAIDSFHPPSHPELLDWLAEDFAASGYDVRRLIRNLAHSSVYQIESSSEAFTDPQWFAVAPSKALTAEVLHRSLVVVFDPEQPDRWSSADRRIEFANQFPDVLAEESLTKVSQGLMLTNGEFINQLARFENSLWLRQLGEIKNDHELVELAFLTIFGRSPDEAETMRCLQFLDGNVDRRESAIEDLAWALVTSAEFRFNH